MKIVKILLILLGVIVLGFLGFCRYTAYVVTRDINTQYANKKYLVKSLDQSEYLIQFNKIVLTGFPFKFAWEMYGYLEESSSAEISYTSPVELGYNLLTKKLYLSYNGEIIAAYKPTKSGFGALIKLQNYGITVHLPLMKFVYNLLRNKEQVEQVINHIGMIRAASEQVEIFDLVDMEKFYHKDHEELAVAFFPRKQYANLDDLINHIPNQYNIRYTVKTQNIPARMRLTPMSFLYGFSSLLYGLDVTSNITLRTEADRLADLFKAIELNADLSLESRYIKVPQANLYYKAGTNSITNQQYSIVADIKIHPQAGLIEKLLEQYSFFMLNARNRMSPLQQMLDDEVKYLITHQEDFKLKAIEDKSLELALKMKAEIEQNNFSILVEDLTMMSGDTGIRIKQDVTGRHYGQKVVKGVLYIKNYSDVIEFFSGYIYRFGKFRFINQDARALYIDVNKIFLKSISDYPYSESNDLSFEYSIDMKDIARSKFGTANIDQIGHIYMLTVYQKLLDNVGYGGNVLSRMRTILPSIDSNDPMLKKILPVISQDSRE